MKPAIIAMLTKEVEADLAAAQAAYQSTKDYKASDDLKQEGKYDTRAIESGYLAGAQLKRVEELKQELQLLESIDLKLAGKQAAAMGSLLELETNGRRQWYFLSSTAGGKVIQVEGKTVMVISVFSPLGREVLGGQKGDEVEIETPSGLKTYQILHIE